ncbi:hypothetical protein VCEM1676A_000387A, partial [Vibrio cholerae O1 str. EM-1676A]
MEQLGSS